jgi:GntR family transcriptional regulator, carbon starvation induced regulator
VQRAAAPTEDIGADGAVLISSAPRNASGQEPVPFDVLRQMREDILAGQFRPNQRLKFEELRARYEASVGTLREGLRHLLSEGLVRAEINRGFTVAPVSAADFLDITALRVQFESQALADAIAHGDEAWEAEIVTSLHLLLKLINPGAQGTRSAEWPARHRRFHQALVAGCRSPWLLHFRAVLFDQGERYRNLGRIYRRTPRDVRAEHEQLARAALDRDVPRALNLAGKHIQGTVENVLANVPGLSGSGNGRGRRH